MTMSDRNLPDECRCDRAARTPENLYFRPRSVFVADFLGESNRSAPPCATSMRWLAEKSATKTDLGRK